MSTFKVVAASLVVVFLLAGCPQGTCVFEFRNLSNHDVIGLYMKPMGGDSWGDNLLDYALEPGETIRFSLDTGCYEFGAITSYVETQTVTLCFNPGDGLWWGVYNTKNAKSSTQDGIANASGVLSDTDRDPAVN